MGRGGGTLILPANAAWRYTAMRHDTIDRRRGNHRLVQQADSRRRPRSQAVNVRTGNGEDERGAASARVALSQRPCIEFCNLWRTSPIRVAESARDSGQNHAIHRSGGGSVFQMDSQLPPLLNPRSDLAGVVLLGGESRRMGRDKAMLPFGPGSMLEYIAQQSAAVCGGGLWLVAAAQGPVRTLPGAGVLRDRHPDRGPLEGIAVALQATVASPATVVVGCDAPFVHPRLISALVDRLLETDVDAVVIREGLRSHPLPGVYRSRVHAVAQAMLEEGQRSLQALLQRLKVDCVDENFVRQFDPDLRVLVNVNTPEDYEAAMRMAGYL